MAGKDKMLIAVASNMYTLATSPTSPLAVRAAEVLLDRKGDSEWKRPAVDANINGKMGAEVVIKAAGALTQGYLPAPRDEDHEAMH
jgi:hypothetical protein